jgi:hypothetical protein
MDLEKGHGLSRYANTYHSWKEDTLNGKNVFKRPLGVVEYSFDTDGTLFEGRADMNSLFTVEIRHSLSKSDFRKRIALVWASLRLQHVLLQAKVHEDDETGRRSFVIGLQNNMDEVIEESSKEIVWVEDLYSEVDGLELHRHCLNVGRIIDPSKCLSRLHVLPLVELPNGNFTFRALIIMAHQISDGLTAYNWFNHFIRIFNQSSATVRRDIERFRHPEEIKKRLPPAQEDLYPPIKGNKAKQRWFWAIMRVLRHVRKTLPPTFVNPLRREQRLPEAKSLEPKFNKLFNYSEEKKPPMNSFNCSVACSEATSTRLMQLCRSIGVSIGAGGFALAGIAMMELHEASYPNILDSERAAFAASFPLNPRAFFGFNTPADSCMLAFSEGIVMPFLPSSLPIEGRFKLIARHANRELKMYQKRARAVVKSDFDPHSTGRILANGFLTMLDRVEGKLPHNRKMGWNPQGELPVKPFPYLATCGVSSVGSTAGYFQEGQHDFSLVGKEGKDFVAEFRNLNTGVRARENEFLIGSSSDHNGIVNFSVSYDGNAISEEATEIWAKKISTLLDEVAYRPRL